MESCSFMLSQLQEFGSTISSSPELAFLANDATLTFTGLVLLFFNFNTPDTKPLVVSSTVESPLGIKFVTTWNGSLVGTVTFIVLTTCISTFFSVVFPYKSVATYVAW